jgi:hypothetical protein
MKEYQSFILTAEGQVKEHYTVKSSDDADATRRAEKFLTTYSVELWDRARRVARFPSKIFKLTHYCEPLRDTPAKKPRDKSGPRPLWYF